MSVETIISQFGYAALVAGLLLEGESVLVLAAFMAHRGYLDLPLVILIGFMVTLASDQFFFWLGRTRGNQWLEKRPAWKPNVEKAKSLLRRNMTLLFIGFRFMYGLRTVMPFVFGISKFAPKRFFFLNAIGAFLWALIFGLAGYLFGHVAEAILVDMGRYELWIALGIVLTGAGVGLYRYRAGPVIGKA
ncbi:MAG TPA: DedA family protein [Anaerolineales bacterium]|nr:DedA family protein [Anaerolineales bacterium]